MGLSSFLVKTLIGGAAAVGIGATIKAANKNKQRRLQEQAEEERRQNTPCYFVDGISEKTFREITKQTAKRFRRLKVTEIDGAVIFITFYSQSGLSDYEAIIDFNDYGHITGTYWLSNDNEDSNLPDKFAECIGKQFLEVIENSNDDSEYIELENDTSNNYENNSSYSYSPDYTNIDKNVFPNFCRKCGVRLDGKPYWCKYCGTQIRVKRDWYCAVCGDHLNNQPNFNSETGLWTCLKCRSINRVKEQFL